MNKSESKYFNTARRMDEALLALLLEKELPYITVKELCARAGVSRFFDRVFSPILSRYGVAKDLHDYIMAFYRHGLVAILMKWVESDCRESAQEIAQVIKMCVGERQQ